MGSNLWSQETSKKLNCLCLYNLRDRCRNDNKNHRLQSGNATYQKPLTVSTRDSTKRVNQNLVKDKHQVFSKTFEKLLEIASGELPNRPTALTKIGRNYTRRAAPPSRNAALSTSLPNSPGVAIKKPAESLGLFWMICVQTQITQRKRWISMRTQEYV